MNIDHAALDSLAARLTSDDETPLTAEDRALLRDALMHLAASQDIIARQSRLLQLHGELQSRIDDLAQAAISGLRSRLDTPNPLGDFDFSGADEARRELLAAVDGANTTRATLAATLAFVRRLLGAGG